MTKLWALLSDLLEWLVRGNKAFVIPKTFLVAAGVAVVAGWLVRAWLYQRCPHCRRLTPRARGGTRRCGRCGREYYAGLRHV